MGNQAEIDSLRMGSSQPDCPYPQSKQPEIIPGYFKLSQSNYRIAPGIFSGISPGITREIPVHRTRSFHWYPQWVT
jgi:hypothetical protein